jgi:hypothetical protein
MENMTKMTIRITYGKWQMKGTSKSPIKKMKRRARSKSISEKIKNRDADQKREARR